MPRSFVCMGFLSLIGVWHCSQSSGTLSAETPTAEPTPGHARQLQTCRDGLVDPNARPEDRRRWAELLLSYRSEESTALVVTLLGFEGNPDVQRALCGVMADRAQPAVEALDPTFVDPLLTLLGSDAEDRRVLAAQALANFPGPDVSSRLGKLASQPTLPLAKRLAAIDALAPNTHRREVVSQLIHLLDADVPEITERVVAALEPVSPKTFGRNVKQWRSWWTGQSRLSKDAWLAEQLRIHRDRLRRVADELQQYREATQRKEEAVTARIGSFQRELYRTLNAEQREVKLTEWLSDPLPEVKRTALAIIKARIADEGKRPAGEVLAALLTALKDGPPLMRRELLEIVQNVKDPAVIETVLQQLDQEKDPLTRLTIFKALGKLDSLEALPALVREIAAPESTSDCVREAAIALGQVAAQAETSATMQEAITALKNRYREVPVDQLALRAALLTAMAGVADASFVPEFLRAVESDDATILREAIRGLRAIGDTSKLPRLRTLMAHPDPLVRLEAIEAVGQLGREEADLERLLTRLNQTDEPNELAREAAWRGFREFLSSRPLRDRIKAAERLRDMPDLEVRYLEGLADTLSTSNSDPADLEAVLDRLAAVLVNQGRHAEAIGHLRALYDILSTRSSKHALPCGLRLLTAVLRGGTNPKVADLIRQLAVEADDEAKAKIVETVAEYLESQRTTATAERIRVLLADLRSIPKEVLGEKWRQLLEEVTARLDNGDTVTTPP